VLSFPVLISKQRTCKLNQDIIIASSADNKYAMPLAAMISSLITNVNKKHDLKFFILDGGVSSQNKKKFYHP